MRKLVHLASASVAIAISACSTSTTGSAAFPDPTPGGPVRPAEAFVAGPENLDALDVSVRPDGGLPDGVVLGYDKTSRTAGGEKPAAPRRYVFLFDRSVTFHPEAFPTCARATLESQGAAGCPAGSQVGSGRSDNYPSGSADVAVFNTVYPNGTRGVLITVPAAGVILENTFEPVGEVYRAEFAHASDEIVPPSATPPGQRGATTRVQVSFGATHREGDRVHSFVRSAARPGDPMRFALWSEFVTGQVIRPTDETPRP